MPMPLTDAARILDHAADELRDIAPLCPCDDHGCLWCVTLSTVDSLRAAFIAWQEQEDAITDEPRPRSTIG